MILVIGTNESGIHGAGAALYALQHEGAVMGVGFGPQGNSFGIPTKSWGIEQTLPLDDIEHYVQSFIRYAVCNPNFTFKVTRIGCGLAGLRDSEVAPMFGLAPLNCEFDTAWRPYLPNAKFWGTF